MRKKINWPYVFCYVIIELSAIPVMLFIVFLVNFQNLLIDIKTSERRVIAKKVYTGIFLSACPKSDNFVHGCGMSYLNVCFSIWRNYLFGSSLITSIFLNQFTALSMFWGYWCCWLLSTLQLQYISFYGRHVGWVTIICSYMSNVTTYLPFIQLVHDFNCLVRI